MAEREPDSRIPPQVQDRRAAPSGVLPKHIQAWVITGLALVMVVIIALSGHNPPKEKPAAAKEAAITETDAQRIQEYEARLKEEAQSLDAAKSQLAHTQETLGLAPTSARSLSAGPAPASAMMEESPASSERRKREEQSLFASNVALTFRKEAAPAAPSSASPTAAEAVARALAAYNPPAPAAAPAAGGPTLPRAPEPPLAAREDEEPRAKANAARDAEIDRAAGPTYRLFEGTVFETVLTNRLDGSFSGPVNCMVTSPVYSRNGQHVLIPAGSRVLGETKKVETFGETRLAVLFHRLVMPDGYSVSLDRLQGLNQIGETGLQDQINHHYVQIFGVSLAIGAVAGLSQANTSVGFSESAADAYRQGAATSLSQSSLRILDRYLNVLPTVTIREGHRVKVYLSEDLLVPAYENHEMPANL